ncbi:Phosphatidylglycerol/phosphatidylinositol transfer protein [Dinochytrium kinnereticum]|nr:Phosphatidylglycerol/phosphatidylinositol transfer protein [Dinochytrium kinnereticum]
MKPFTLMGLLALFLSTSTAATPQKRDRLQFPLFELMNTTQPIRALDGSVVSCGGPDDVFQPKRISLIPDPPKRGKPLTVEVLGDLSEDVTVGSYADVIAKLGVIKLVEKRLDLCEEIKQIGRECPVQKGSQEITHTVDIPREVPPGKYSISVDAFTADGKPLTCLRIQFRM